MIKFSKCLTRLWGGGSLGKACKTFNYVINDNIEYIGIEKEEQFFNNAKELIFSNNRIYELQRQQKVNAGLNNENNLLKYLGG